MITREAVEEQLKRIGFNFRFWGRSEVKELSRILMEDEVIAQAANGQYDNGFAMLIATNHRVLLVDKKPLLYLTVEDVRFDMITEFNYHHRLLNATVKIHTTGKTLVFTSWNHVRLRKLLEFTQAHVLQLRQQAHMAQQFQAAAAAQYAQLHAAQAVPPANYIPNTAPSPATNQVPAEVSQAPAYASPAAADYAPANASANTPIPAPASAPLAEPAQQASDPGLADQLARKRTTLGTYTRSKLPSFHRRPSTPTTESGEVYQSGYNPQTSLRDLNLPYEA